MKHLALQQPVNFFVPITRVDPETRTVTGYCYTQPKVKGDKWNLKREALERASQKYMEMPCIRAMHRQDIAAGVGMALRWDDTGCEITCEVVDDQEWRKVEKKVYRGFSIGGIPTVARGHDVEEFEWKETSLVDRPADSGALFTMVRAEGFSPDAVYDVLILEGDETIPDNVPEVLARLERDDEASAASDAQAPGAEASAAEAPQAATPGPETTDSGATAQTENAAASADTSTANTDVGEEPNLSQEATDGNPEEAERTDAEQHGSEAGEQADSAAGTEDGGSVSDPSAQERADGSDAASDPGRAERRDHGAGSETEAGTGRSDSSPGTGAISGAEPVRPDDSPGGQGSVRRDGPEGTGSAIRDSETEPAPGSGDRAAADGSPAGAADTGNTSDGSQSSVSEAASGEGDVNSSEVDTTTAAPNGVEPDAADTAQRLDSTSSVVAATNDSQSEPDVERYSADQPRDENGRWTGGKGASRSSGNKSGKAANKKPVPDKDGQFSKQHRAAQDKANDVVSKLNSDRRPAAASEWISSIRQAVTAAQNKITDALNHVADNHPARELYDAAHQSFTEVVSAARDGRVRQAVEFAKDGVKDLMAAGSAAGVKRTDTDVLVMRVLGIHPLTVDREVEEAFARIEAEPEDEPEIERGITSETAPTRENLEGARQKVKRVTRFAHSKGDTCLHTTRADAVKCEAGVERSATVDLSDQLSGPITITVPTFRDYAVAMTQQQQQRGLKTACRAFWESMVATDDEAARHRSVDEFADFMHDYVEWLEDSRQANASDTTLVPVWFDDYTSPYPAPDCCASECSDPLRADMITIRDVLRSEPAVQDQTDSDVLQRLDEVTQRATDAENELVIVRADLSDSIERVTTLERSLKAAEEREQVLRKTPIERKLPIQFSSHVERHFAANAAPLDADGSGSAELQRKAWQEEHDRIEAQAGSEPNAEKRRHMVQRLITLENLLRSS